MSFLLWILDNTVKCKFEHEKWYSFYHVSYSIYFNHIKKFWTRMHLEAKNVSWLIYFDLFSWLWHNLYFPHCLFVLTSPRIKICSHYAVLFYNIEPSDKGMAFCKPYRRFCKQIAAGGDHQAYMKTNCAESCKKLMVKRTSQG